MKTYTVEDIYKIYEKCPRCNTYKFLTTIRNGETHCLICWERFSSKNYGYYYFQYKNCDSIQSFFISNDKYSFNIFFSITNNSHYIEVCKNMEGSINPKRIIIFNFGDFRIPSEDELNKIVDNLIFL